MPTRMESEISGKRSQRKGDLAGRTLSSKDSFFLLVVCFWSNKLSVVSLSDASDTSDSEPDSELARPETPEREIANRLYLRANPRMPVR
ncbi:hypothetical protein NEOLI_003027 [Neolecta irregularis DAH-3]|uniref:Uncharacterized protein n=1 Tax=Neolecta irregularis (strain DAH-3) TaxID=1198029 RepID=A0A1U7LGT9_NEOID|nr:hypothetical protein NEOLI_003027 [Neolecta irregularis DAH-3]|eukprot:OLL21741.1 hypothetical protein NEOLI_003027 [Neolecta irregularis DAH-3]